MIQPPESEDTHWLNAVAGNPSTAADPKVNQQALALRKALQARSQSLGQSVPEADTAQYQRLLFRLRREGLARNRPIWKSLPAWGVAASLVLGISLAVNMRTLLPEHDDGMVIRGGGQATVLIVSDPEARLAELLKGLSAAKAEPQIERPAKGKIQLKLKATQETLDYLDTQRINPTVKDGQIVLLLSSQADKR